MSVDVAGKEIIDDIIIGRVDPHIYAFTTNTVPNYLKVGDTYRSVSQRLKEWTIHFPTLKKIYENKATVSDNVYFRDYSVHKYLENDLNKKRLLPNDIDPEIHYSKEFFKDTTSEDLNKALRDIQEEYYNNTCKYEYYDAEKRLPKIFQYSREDNWILRPNQQEVVNNFKNARANGRSNLLMYAVMRFGKSFTSLCCALEMEAKVVLVVSGKADVKEEWKKTVEKAGNFKEYIFLNATDLDRDNHIIEKTLDKQDRVVVFLTLQDLQGEKIKEKHKEIFNSKIDLLIIDETHFGARAEEFGSVLRELKNIKKDSIIANKIQDDSVNIEVAQSQIKSLNAEVKLHLSGTPYRILMGNEFKEEDIISFVQFTDIIHKKEQWDEENLKNDEKNEWENPYFGVPQMIRFAFNPTQSSIDKMETLKKSGISLGLSALFEPKSIRKNRNNDHRKFLHKSEVLDMLMAIDGTKKDDNLLDFLNYDKIKDGKMCRHMVMVLPYCASCDSMEELISNNKDKFENLSEYEIINISGVDGSKSYKSPNDIKEKIEESECNNKKTLTLTVNRMLTGSTVEQWDTMLYLKDTSSPQEYDQAIFRLQNQYVRELFSEDSVIKENLKPQTLLVDFDPNRLFRLQEHKSLINNSNLDESGNKKLENRIKEELRISPVITMNHRKIRQVTATNILEAVSEYNKKRSVLDEVKDILIDKALFNDEAIRKVIEQQYPLGHKEGLGTKAHEGEEDDLDIEIPDEELEDKDSSKKTQKEATDDKEINNLEKQLQTYYQRILFFAFLTKNSVASLGDIISVLNESENMRLSRNLFLEKSILERLNEVTDPFKLNSLDYKIQNISKLSEDESMAPLERATTSIKKFNRMSSSEVITSSEICEDMVDLIPNEKLTEFIDNGKNILDISSKSGEYAVALVKKLVGELGYSIEQINDKIYSIPTSSIAYEFTRRFYEILGLNIANISIETTANQLISGIDKSADYKEICDLLKKGTMFGYDGNEKGDDDLKFGAIVGNPPYHVRDGGAQASANPIYQHFVMTAMNMDVKYVSLIIPTRWYTGGKRLDDFRHMMLNNTKIKELHDFQTPEDIFPDTNNRGGVCYFLYDASWDSSEKNTKIVTHKNNSIISESYRPMKTDGLNIFIRDNKGSSMLEKINIEEVDTLSNHVSAAKAFGFRTYFIRDKRFRSSPDGLEAPIKCFGRAGKIGFVKRDEISSHKEWIDKWKVYVPESNNIATELNDDNQNSFVGSPKTICTETFLVVGAELELNRDSSENLAKYLRTKFARYLHGLAKSSQHGTKKTYIFVPLQDFNSSSKEIDWSQDLNYIDEQLFNKYKLNDEEKNYIKMYIKDMK